MFDLLKNVKNIAKAPLNRLEELAGAKKNKKPKIRSELKYAKWNFYFICDVCGVEYGPKNSLVPQIDGGTKILSNVYMHCPECDRFICKPNCWNYNVGKCLSCAPSKEIDMQKRKPNIRSEHKIPMWQYYFVCDICDKEYGPEKLLTDKPEEAMNLHKKHYRQCPECGKYICRSQCWNYEKGTCTVCNELTPPEYIVQSGKLKKEYYLICSVCRKQLGPISDVDWEKVKKIAIGATKIALGVISPTFAISGSYDIAVGVKQDTSQERSKSEVATEAKTDLAQCPGCNRWVCIENCWDKNIGYCNACSNESKTD